MATGNVTGQEVLQVPGSAERETLRSEETEAGACTTYSIQAVAGVGTPSCAIVGIDYGRRP
ncbi:MAG: hypothetical protein RLZZ403_22 [Pseudomonadota bacterium]|jgi:hypothetical protein